MAIFTIQNNNKEKVNITSSNYLESDIKTCLDIKQFIENGGSIGSFRFTLTLYFKSNGTNTPTQNQLVYSDYDLTNLLTNSVGMTNNLTIFTTNSQGQFNIID